MMQTYPRLTFIGAGNMAQALVGGLLAKGWPASQITMTDIHLPALDTLHTRLGVHIETDNRQAVAAAELVLLAVKPQVMETVCRDLAPALSHHPLIISIAAGITTEKLTAWLGEQPLVRVMPNTPALVQTGAAGLFAGPRVSTMQRQLATQILESAGLALWFEEESALDTVTAISGSGPAYFFLLMEAMTATAVSFGLEPASATKLVLQTALGAAKLASTSDDSPAELRRKVTSPGGTTAAALRVFEEGGFSTLVATALAAAQARSIELSGKH